MSAYQFSRKPHKVPRVDTKHRYITTQIPIGGTVRMIERLQAVESRSMHGGLPIIWHGAKGAKVFDIALNEYIDFTSGIFVANVGHANIKVVNAIEAAIEGERLHAYTYPTEIRIKYLERLTQWSGFEKAFLVSSGTEATEAALKLMRLHGERIGRWRQGIVCVKGAFHGRTMGAEMMNGTIPESDIHHIRPDDLEWADYLEAKNICGFMLETFQGWSAKFYSPAWVQDIAAFCKANDILLCFDEMQAGFARTGKKFGYEHYGVKPDLICVGKGMGGGLPLSGVLGRADVLDIPSHGEMSSTHSANPVCCAAGLAVLKEIDRLDLVNESRRKGLLMAPHLEDIVERFQSHITHMNARGLIAALIFSDTDFATRVVERCMQRGLLVVHTGRESIKIGPPLTIQDDALIEGLAVLGEAIAEIEKENKWPSRSVTSALSSAT